jgi:histidine triad (HIT) family protein
MGCIFCDIASGKMEAHRIFENEQITVFLDAFPVNAGHMLIVPKRHVKDLSELDDELGGLLFSVSKRMAEISKKALGAESANIVTAPATIEHFHMHVIPRYDYDLMGLLADLDNKRELPEEEMAEIESKLKKELTKKKE